MLRGEHASAGQLTWDQQHQTVLCSETRWVLLQSSPRALPRDQSRVCDEWDGHYKFVILCVRT